MKWYTLLLPSEPSDSGSNPSSALQYCERAVNKDACNILLSSSLWLPLPLSSSSLRSFINKHKDGLTGTREETETRTQRGTPSDCYRVWKSMRNIANAKTSTTSHCTYYPSPGRMQTRNMKENKQGEKHRNVSNKLTFTWVSESSGTEMFFVSISLPHTNASAHILCLSSF